MNFTFGTDPEFMVVDRDGNIRSAIRFIEGDRDNRIMQGEYGFYYDNVLAECAVKPANSKEEAVANIREALTRYAEILEPHGVRLTTRASHEFEDAELDTGKMVKSPLGEMVREGRFAGCKEEKCAYTLSTIDPKAIQKSILANNLRTAGGHVHLGTELGKSYIPCVSLIRMLDLFVGLPSVILDRDESSLRRRSLYGFPGRYRQPKWGCEYRTLGNFWLSSPGLVELIYDLCAFTVEFVEEGRHEEFWTVDEEKLLSDDFWNEGGDPTKLHTCHGYDVDELLQIFTGKEEAMPFAQMLTKYLPSDIYSRIFTPERPPYRYDLYKEWNL